MDQVDVFFTAQIVLFLVSLLFWAALVFRCICALRIYTIRNNLLPARLGAQGSMHDSLCVMQFSVEYGTFSLYRRQTDEASGAASRMSQVYPLQYLGAAEIFSCFLIRCEVRSVIF